MDIEEKIEAAIRETLVIDNPQGLNWCMKKIMKALGDTFVPMIDTIDQLQAEKQALIDDMEKIKELANSKNASDFFCYASNAIEGLKDIEFKPKKTFRERMKEKTAEQTQETFDKALEE